MSSFFNTHRQALADFSRMSCAVGSKADYVQGGGGNTSVKLDDGLMSIKASGFHLCDVQPDGGYAVLDGGSLRAFYEGTDPDDFEDVEAAGAQKARELTLDVPGLPPLRPSVEAGFHSLLSLYVTHSHSVYGNLAACCAEAERVFGEALSGAPYAFALVPYVNPGAKLTYTIRDILNKVKKESGRVPAILLMRNHGLIAHADTADECLSLHEDANQRFKKYFSIKEGDFPLPRVKSEGSGFVSDTPWLQQRLKGNAHPDSLLLEEPLYPDQMVFFQGTLGIKAIIDRQSGQILYDLPQKTAQTLEETLCAVVFIRETLHQHGLTPISMGEAARAFIKGWESEKYRKSLAEGSK